MISLADQKRRIDKGELSPDAALAESLAAIDAHEPAIGAFAHRAKNPRAQKEGPLRGIAVGIKDIIDTADMPTEMGSAIYRGHQPRADAPVVMLLKQAGATIVGKTTTTAFAANDPTPTRNPHNHAHTPGGSSSGSAASVGGGMIPLALGTQTGGSVIRPASFCGAAAIKPSYRLLPTVGVKCFSWTLDTVGLFAADVESVALGLSAMTNRPELLAPALERPAHRRGDAGVRRSAGSGRRGCAPGLRRAPPQRRALRSASLKMPDIVAEAWRIHPTLQQYEAHQAFAWEYGENYDAMAPLLRGRMDESRNIPAGDYDAARTVAAKARAAVTEILKEVDVLLALSAPGAPPKGLDSTGDPTFNRLWTLMGTPCVNVPAIVVDGNLPIGVQIIADYGDDAKALAGARFLERALRS